MCSADVVMWRKGCSLGVGDVGGRFCNVGGRGGVRAAEVLVWAVQGLWCGR